VELAKVRGCGVLRRWKWNRTNCIIERGEEETREKQNAAAEVKAMLLLVGWIKWPQFARDKYLLHTCKTRVYNWCGSLKILFL